MDAFSYLSVLLSIILGLAITQVLQGYRGLLLARDKVRIYWPTLIWSVLMLLFATQNWWASFGLADRVEWSFAAFAMVLLQTVLLYMMAALVLPEIERDRTTDLRDHYYREARPFFALALLMLAVSIGKDWVLNAELPGTANLAFHVLFAVVAIVAMSVRKSIAHEMIAPVMALFTVSYIALLFARL